ncbi:MAG: SpoIIE family protein phosphatase [Pirellulales bacterium]
MAFLQVVQGREPGRRFELANGESVIGRSSDCAVSLDVAAVSRRHALVREDGGRFYLEDLGSRNGTFVNNERVGDRAPLSDGDQILVCDQLLAFSFGGAPASLGGIPSLHESSLSAPLEDDDGSEGDQLANVQATLDLGPGTGSWRLSANPEVKLGAMIEISHNLGKTLTVEEILPKLLDSLFKIFVQADRGFIVMPAKPGGPLVSVADKARRSDVDEKMRFSRTIIEEAMRSRRAILSADAATDQRFNMAQSITDLRIRSMICAPMIDSDGEPLGAIQIDTMNQRSRFTDEDLEVLAGVAGQAALSMDNAKMHEQAIEQRAVQRDLELARQMQRGLLPAAPPKVPGYSFFDYYQSARQVGGDYYDYVLLPDGRFAVIVGDVAGKGVAAALLMARLSSDVRFSLASERDPAQAVRQINRSFLEHDWEDRFVTMIVAVVDPREHQLTIVNAGHMAPLLRSIDGKVEELGEDLAGLPLGVADGYEYESCIRMLEPGDCVTIYTDGFSEAMNAKRELYGTERLTCQIAVSNIKVAELGQRVLGDVSKFVDGFAQSDDMCLACFGREE